MDWVVLSFLTAICYCAHSLLQKHAFQRYVNSILVFSFWGELFQAVLCLGILFIYPLPYPLFSLPVALLSLGALIRIGMILFRAWAIQREEEISRIVPILDTYPVFVAILAVMSLGENLLPLHWLAIGLVIVAVFLASSRQPLAVRRLRRRSTILVGLGFSVSAAAYIIVGKAALEYVSFWHVVAFSSLLTAPVSALAAKKWGSWPELVSMLRRPIPLTTMAASAMVIMLAFIFGFAAYERGPVSLSSAIMATRPILIVAYTAFISHIFPRLVIEPNAQIGIRSKVLAAFLVTVAVSAIAFA